MNEDQKQRNAEALSRGVDEAIAAKLGCSPDEDPLAMLVDRELAAAGLLPPEALAELTPEKRAIVLDGRTEAEASENVAALEDPA